MEGLKRGERKGNKQWRRGRGNGFCDWTSNKADITNHQKVNTEISSSRKTWYWGANARHGLRYGNRRSVDSGRLGVLFSSSCSPEFGLAIGLGYNDCRGSRECLSYRRQGSAGPSFDTDQAGAKRRRPYTLNDGEDGVVLASLRRAWLFLS